MTDDTKPADSRDAAAVVHAALRKLVKPSTPQEVADATGLPVATVQRTLGRLVSVREARRAGGGRFTAAKHS